MSTAKKQADPDSVEVWLDSDVAAPCRVGILSHDRGQVRFAYDAAWLRSAEAFQLDPDLTLASGSFFPKAEAGNFGIFLDSSPDRWGQTLMKRREAVDAKDEERSPRSLHAWDYLLGVQDQTRQGALRFKAPGVNAFLASGGMAAPPVTSLGELQAIADQLSSRHIDDLDALRRWLAVLVAPGASLGGARPKANFTQADGSLWIGKFPARDDDRDVGAWEFLVHGLAKNAGIDVPPARVLRLNSPFHTFCVKRFDREGGARKFYASAMTLLRKDSSEGSSYLEIAQFLRSQGAGVRTGLDLRQLFRRVLFNVATGNRDDHLRNHGFVLGTRGWRLAPAFDVNPNIDKADHVLSIDDSDTRPSLDTALATAEFYDLGADEACSIRDEVLRAVDAWQERAGALGIARADVLTTAAAFEAHTAYQRAAHSRLEGQAADDADPTDRGEAVRPQG